MHSLQKRPLFWMKRVCYISQPALTSYVFVLYFQLKKMFSSCLIYNSLMTKTPNDYLNERAVKSHFDTSIFDGKIKNLIFKATFQLYSVKYLIKKLLVLVGEMRLLINKVYIVEVDSCFPILSFFK